MMNLYLALGDSITVGYGVESSFAFPMLYAASLRRHYPDLCLINFGVNGLTTGGLLDLLKFNRGLRSSVSQASLLTLTIGSNDLLGLISNTDHPVDTSTLSSVLNKMDKNFAHIGEEVRRLNPSATMKVATIYNPLLKDAQCYIQAQRLIDNANAIIVTLAKRKGFTVIYLDRQFRGKEHVLISSDHVHPNAVGYQVIAKAFARH